MKTKILILLLISGIPQFGFSQVAPTNVNVRVQNSPSLYSDVTQTNSKYNSTYVPGFSDALITFSKTLSDRFNQNYATYNALVNWLTNLAKASPSFDTSIFSVWKNYSDRLIAYRDKHNDFENSGPWLTQIKMEVQETADGYFPNLPRLYNDQGVKEYNKNNYQQAIQYFSNALQINPDIYPVYANRAEGYSELNQYDLALKDWNTFFSYGKQQAGHYNDRGLVKDNLNDFSGALNDYTKAIEMDPRNPAFFSNRASCKVELNDNIGAISDYTKAIELDPTALLSYMQRANAKDELKDYIGSISDYSKAIELKPDNTEAYYLRGYAKFHLKQFHEALIDFNKAIDLGGDGKTAYRFRAELKLELHDYKGCIEDCDKIILSKPTSAPNSLFLRGRANYLLGYKSKACEDWSKSGEQGNKEAYTYISKYCK